MSAILAKKLGMTQVFQEDGSVARVTVLEAGPCPVTAVRTAERDGYEAVQFAFGLTKEKHLSKPELGHLKKADAPPMRHLVEFRGMVARRVAGRRVGDGRLIRGWHACKDRWASPRARASRVRSNATTSNAVPSPTAHTMCARPARSAPPHGPARVTPGIRGPGQMGNKRATQPGLEIVAVDPKKNLMLVRGSVPGPAAAWWRCAADA